MSDVPEAKPARCRHSHDEEQDEKPTRKADQGKVASRKVSKVSSQITSPASRSQEGSKASVQHSHGRRLSGSTDQGGSVSSEVPSSRGSVRSEVPSDKLRGSGRNSLASADSITSDVSAGKNSSISERYGSDEVQDGAPSIAYSTDEDLSKSASTLKGGSDGRSWSSLNSVGNDASDHHSEDDQREDDYEVRSRVSPSDYSRQTDADSSSFYSKELEDGTEGTPSDMAAVLSSFIQAIREETERMESAESLKSIETSHVRGILGELTETLRESEGQSLRLFEGIEAIREAAQGLRKTLEARLNRSNDAEVEAMVDANGNTDNKKAHSRAVAAVSAAKALLAEVALDVASATQMAAEAESAAAEAAAAAETAKEELAEIEDRLDKVEDAEQREEDQADEAPEAVEDEHEKDEENAEDRLGDGSTDGDDQERQDKEGARSHSSRASLRQGEDAVDGDAQEDDNEKAEEEKEDGEDEGDNNNDNGTEGDGEINEEDEKREDTPKPPASPKRKRSIKENVLDWPYHVLNLPDDDVTGDEIGCVVRYKEEYFSTAVPEFRCVISNHLSTDAIADSEELVSHVVTVEHAVDNNAIVSELEVPIVVAIPYSVSARMLSTKEFVVKFRGGNEDAWKFVPMLVADSSFEDHKGPFAEVRTYNLGSFAVVSRLNKERQTITKKGGVVKSSSDSRMNVSYPPGVCSLMSVTLQVQPAEHAVGDLRARMRHCSDLIAASPIIHLSHSPGKPFDKPVTVTIPCPPNPLKVPAATTASSSAGKTPEKQAPLSPDGAVIIRGTKSSIFGGDPAEDTLHLMHRQSNWGYWNEVENANIRQVRKDLVSIELDKPMDRVLILRMTADGRYPAKNIAQTFEKALQIKYATIVLQHREDDPQRIVVQCVPARQLESALRRLNQEGYEGPPEPSGDIAMTEGQEITMRFTGNIKIVGRDQITFTFHSQRRNVVEFSIEETNKFGNHSSDEYRGMAEFYGRPRITLSDMEDPEEVLLREADAKAAEKESKHSGSSMLTKSDKKKPDGDGIGGRDYQSLRKIETDLICKLPVSIPKADPEPPLPPSRYRATAIDIGGTVSNANLRWLSTELGNEWESLSAALGIKRSRLQSIKRNNPIKVDQQVLDMLVTWRSMLPRAYDKERKLCRALVKCGRYDLAEELKERDATATEFSHNNNVNMLDVDDY